MLSASHTALRDAHPEYNDRSVCWVLKTGRNPNNPRTQGTSQEPIYISSRIRNPDISAVPGPPLRNALSIGELFGRAQCGHTYRLTTMRSRTQMKIVMIQAKNSVQKAGVVTSNASGSSWCQKAIRYPAATKTAIAIQRANLSPVFSAIFSFLVRFNFRTSRIPKYPEPT